MPEINFTDRELERLLEVTETALNSERGRARYYKSSQGSLSSNSPELEAARAQAAVDDLKSLVAKLKAITKRSRF